jgi:MFS superfamily sulfate permease-like transporter
LAVSRAINDASNRHREVVLDLSRTRLVDHTVMEKLHQLSEEICRSGRKLSVIGLEQHCSLSNHPFATRKNNQR